MAIYDGFFDAEYDEETGKYDRIYGSDDFCQYFSDIIGSGVCITEDEDSFKVRLSGQQAVISTGYLFIRGHWLRIKNEQYIIQLSGSGRQAISARLITTTESGERTIKLEAIPESTSYQENTLVIAIVDPSKGTVQDTRYDTTLCGVIDSAGGMSTKIQYALNYINNQAPAQFEAIEKEISTKESQIKKEINDAETLTIAKINSVESILDDTDPPIGSIRFSASDLGEYWIKCNGKVISQNDYPDLVKILLNIPGADGRFDPDTLIWERVTYTNSPGGSSAVGNYGIVYGNGLFVTANYKQSIQYSDDGKTWTIVNVQGVWYDIAFGNDIFVLCGSSSYNSGIAYSSTGKNGWTLVKTENCTWYSITFGLGVFVKVGINSSGNYILRYSTTAQTWTNISFTIPFTPSTDTKLFSFKDKLFLFHSNQIYYSTNVFTWQKATYPSFSGAYGIACNDDVIVLLASGQVLYSFDGVNWTSVEIPSFPDGTNPSCRGICFGGGVFISASTGYNKDGFIYSFDGINWTAVRQINLEDNLGDKMAYGAGKFVYASYNQTPSLHCASPFDKVKLPDITMNGIQAYIKTKKVIE